MLQINCEKYCLILATIGINIYDDLKSSVKRYFKAENIAELDSMLYLEKEKKTKEEKNKEEKNIKEQKKKQFVTRIGRYSIGSLCKNHPYIKSIGAFCSFAIGCDVVVNHEIQYITTHPMIYAGGEMEDAKAYVEYKGSEMYFEGVLPQIDKIKKGRRIEIGNDVWLGKNVIVTNYSNIGNGVIAGAGAIITKDVPDYAVIGGAPARIIRFRYSPEEIAMLNKIAWWNWTDDEIRERYNDFYLPINEFIQKYAID